MLVAAAATAAGTVAVAAYGLWWGISVLWSSSSSASAATGRAPFAVVDHSLGETALSAVVETAALRLLVSDGIIIGAEHLDPRARSQAAFASNALMEAVGFLALPAPRRALCLGLGAGAVPHFLRERGIAADVVEYDSGVVRLAESHFLFGSRHEHGGARSIPRPATDTLGRVVRDDALAFVRRGPSSEARGEYDCILSDLWAGDNHGASLRRGFLEATKRWLRANGTLGVNLVGFADGPRAALAPRVVRTMRSIFAHVAAFAEADPAEPSAAALLATEPGNLLVVGSDAPLRFRAPTAGDYPEEEHGDAGELARELATPGSTYHLHASFHRWQPPGLAADAVAAAAPVEEEDEWEALRAEREATAAGMREQQRPMLPEEAWAALDRLHAQVEARRPGRPRRTRRTPRGRDTRGAWGAAVKDEVR